ncbi:hypothetical protein B0H16DRAFT_805208 [Mycena metata]|uniref:Uncharacterized protein n=1 Tax=Mycena metata TaxID=1033252 RepID=A0AAD7K838_9AGAR|nr:hypothetical protein B0H16DRAFT_805208 [Mycena metata]
MGFIAWGDSAAVRNELYLRLRCSAAPSRQAPSSSSSPYGFVGLCGAFQVAPRIHRPQLGLVLVLANGCELAMDAEVYDAHSLDRGTPKLYRGAAVFAVSEYGAVGAVGRWAVGVVATVYTRFFLGNVFAMVAGTLFQSKCLPGSGTADSSHTRRSTPCSRRRIPQTALRLTDLWVGLPLALVYPIQPRRGLLVDMGLFLE